MNFIFEKINKYFNFWEQMLNSNNKKGLGNINKYSENLICEILNKLNFWDLTNANKEKNNIAGYDLITKKYKILVQVTSNSNISEKIKDTIKKTDLIQNDKFTLKIVFLKFNINKKIFNSNKFVTEHIHFDIKKDILCFDSISTDILNANIEKQQEILNILEKYFSDVNFFDKENMFSQLAQTIQILVEFNKNKDNNFNKLKNENFNIFDISKKISYNNLSIKIQKIIDDYKIYVSILDEIYDQIAANGSISGNSILNLINKKYLDSIQDKEKQINSNLIYDDIFEKLRKIVINSINYSEQKISLEDLNWTLDLILVDAFIKCKIFEEPPKEENNDNK